MLGRLIRGLRSKPFSLHPRNRRYFLYRGRALVLVTSAEHYGSVLNLDFDYRAYLGELRARGLNHTRVFSGTYREVPGSFGITDNPLAPAPGRYACPWARSASPGYYDGGNKFDLKRWDRGYFLRLKDFMRRAALNGIIVELNLFCPHYDDELWKASPMNAVNNVNEVGDCPRSEVYTLKHDRLTAIQLDVVRKLVTELNSFDNLYFEVCNEPYAGVVAQEWQDLIVRDIVESEARLPRQHLVSLNVANHRADIVDPNPGVSIFNFHYCVPPDVVSMNYHLAKPIGENETGFRGGDDVTYRTEGWEFILAGGAIYNNLDYSFTTSHPRGACEDYKSPGGGSEELRRQLGILRRFIHNFNFVSMRPDNDVIRSGIPEGVVARVLAERGRQYAAYLRAPLGEEASLKFDASVRKCAGPRTEKIGAELVLELPAASYRAEWIDPSGGKSLREERFKHGGGARKLRSPLFTEDVALRIVRK